MLVKPASAILLPLFDAPEQLLRALEVLGENEVVPYPVPVQLALLGDVRPLPRLPRQRELALPGELHLGDEFRLVHAMFASTNSWFFFQLIFSIFSITIFTYFNSLISYSIINTIIFNNILFFILCFIYNRNSIFNNKVYKGCGRKPLLFSIDIGLHFGGVYK